MTPELLTVHSGTSPLVLSLPHVGTWMPEAMRTQVLPRAWQFEDTDWHLERLYGFAKELGATVLVPKASRTVVDLNRPPQDMPMYPGANNTGLAPRTFFTGEPIYFDGQAPTPAQVQERVAQYWQPYHQALAQELARVKALHGHVVLWDGHSIKSHLPWLFEGKLWDLNLGTAEGASCAPALRSALMQVLASQTQYTHKTDGRFKGGYITRHYGQPAQNVHAVQLEMCWSCYMSEAPPYAYSQALASAVQPVLRSLLSAASQWRPGL